MITIEYLTRFFRTRAPDKFPARTDLDEGTVFDDLGLTSLDLVELVMALETELDVEFDYDRLGGAQTLGDVVAVANAALGDAGR